MTSFFVQDLGLALVAETCPHRPSKRSMMVRRRKTVCFFFLSFFLNEPIAGTL